MKRRTLLGAAGASILAAPELAQGYPDKPIRMIVPYPPGGGTDGLGRITADRLSEKLGQQIATDIFRTRAPGLRAEIGT